MTLRVAVVGTGNAAKHHVAAIRATAGLELTTVGGHSLASAQAFVRDTCPEAVPMMAADAVRAPAADAVVIAVPASAQPDLAVAAFEHGKHVLCEKPLAPTIAGAERIERAWRLSGKVGMTNFCFRFVPEIADFKSRLGSGVCGTLSIIQAEWVLASRLDASLPHNWKADVESGGGVLQNFGSHVLDYLFWDRNEVRVRAASQRTLIPSRRTTSGAMADATGDEMTTIWCDVPGWCPVVIHLSLVTRPPLGHRIVARGSDGTLSVHNTAKSAPGGPFALRWSTGPVLGGAPTTGEDVPSSPDGVVLSQLFERVLAQLVAAAEHSVLAYEPDISAGVRAVRLVEQIQACAQGVM